MSIIPKIKLFTDKAMETLKFLPSSIKETVENRTWIPLEIGGVKVREPINKAMGFATKFLTPKSPDEAMKMGMVPIGSKENPKYLDVMGAVGSIKDVGKEAVNVIKKSAVKAIKSKAPEAFEGFKDLTTKVIEKLKGRSTVSKQFISDLTNAPELKQVERDLIRNVLDSYGGVETDVVRYSHPKSITTDSVRGGTWYATPESKQFDFKNEMLSGGDVKTSTNLKYTKPLVINTTNIGQGSMSVLHNANLPKGYRTIGQQFITNVDKLIKDRPYGGYIGDPIASEVYKVGDKLGWDKGMMKQMTKGDTRKDFVVDKLVQEGLQKNGYDALVLKNKGDTHIFKFGGDIISPDQIPVQEFADKVKSELLPLKMKNTQNKPVWENIVLPDELRGNIESYTEHIWESPIKTSAGETHFGFRRDAESSNYFGHTRIEDISPISPKDYVKKLNEGMAKGEDIRKLSYRGDTRRIIEVQSDLYQKGKLESELKNATAYDDLLNRGVVKKKSDQANRQQMSKLQQYNDPTAHFRMVREEVKQAAIDGKTKLQFPTGETAMKIEGLSNEKIWQINTDKGYERLTTDMLKTGEEVVGPQGDWIITDILGDGKFKAVPKNRVVGNSPGSTYSRRLGDEKRWYDPTNEEQFDISGKVDTSNPIYRFYEKDLGSYLRNKFGAQIITDNKGVKWWELDIKPEQANAPIEAFSAIPFLGALQKDKNSYNESEGKIPFLNKLNKPLFIQK